MRRFGVRGAAGLGVIGVLTIGCLGENPAWQNTSAGTTDAGESSSSSSSSGTTVEGSWTTSVPTTGGTLEGSGTGDESSSGDPTTGAPGTSTGVAETTGGVKPMCSGTELVPVSLAPDQIEDAGLAPPMLVPCMWNGLCEELNFGATEYFRMVSTPALGKTLGLFRFNVGPLNEWIESIGYEPEDLLGFELEVVFYEPRNLPTASATFNVDAIHADNADFPEGGKLQQVAGDGESSGACKSRMNGECVDWRDKVYPLATSVNLGTIEVTADAVAKHDYDGMNNNIYHATLRSSLLPIEKIREVTGSGPPTFVLSLESERGTSPEDEIGIKFQESPEFDPALFAVFCTGDGGG